MNGFPKASGKTLRSRVLGLTALSLLSLGGSLGATVIHTETFDNNTGSTLGISTVGWKANWGSGANAANESNTGYDNGPVVAPWIGPDGNPGTFVDRGFHYFEPWMYWTESQNFGDIGQLERIEFDMRNNAYQETPTVIRVALRIGGDWYVSSTTFNTPPSDVNNYHAHILQMSGSDFLNLPFVSGVTMGPPGGVTALPGSGEVTAVGLYTESKERTIRMDNFTVISGGSGGGGNPGGGGQPASYTETFDNGTGSPVGISTVAWKANWGSGANAANESNTGYDNGPVVAPWEGLDGSPGTFVDRGFHYFQPWIYWTEAQDFGDIGQLERIEFDMRNSDFEDNQSVFRVVLRIGGNWYASQETFSSSNGNLWESKSLNVQTGAFSGFSFTSGSSLGPVGGTVALPGSGTVTAVGLYTESKLRTIRMDNFTVISGESGGGGDPGGGGPLAEYMEPFENLGGGHAGISSAGWKANWGSGANVANESNTSTGGGPIIATFSGPDGDPGIFWLGNFNRNQRWMYWTEIQTFGDITQIGRITFDLRNSHPGENLRVALRIDGNWYVSEEVFNNPVEADWESQSLILSESAFLNLSFSSGSTLGTPGGVTALPGSGEVTAVGLYNANMLNTIRIDNFAVLSGATDEVFWTGGGGNGNFQNGGNWNTGAPPANNDWQHTAVFGPPANPSTVALSADRDVKSLRFDTAGWTLTGFAFDNLRTVSSGGSGTNMIASGLAIQGSHTWTVDPGNELLLSGGLYLRNHTLALTGGGTVRMTQSPSGFTSGAYGIQVGDVLLQIDQSTLFAPGASADAAVWLTQSGSELLFAGTVSQAEALIANGVIVNLTGFGLNVMSDSGGNYVWISPDTEDPQPFVPGDWQLTFQDNFTGNALDGTKWRLGQHWSGIAGVANVDPANVKVENGKLHLTMEERTTDYGEMVTRNFATGEISTFKNFRQRYGLFEARIRYPAVTGLWPAFWLMPDRAQYGWRDNYARSYMKFDLSGVNPGTIQTAELRMNVSSMDSGGVNNVLFMRLEDDSWSEGTITWNNAPTPDPLWIEQKWNQASVGNVMTVDVTDYVAEEMAGDQVISFVLADTFMRDRAVRFHSRTASNPADRPQLIVNGVTYTATEDATVRWGSHANSNFGSGAELMVRDAWGNTADTFNGGMEIDIMESLGIWGPSRTSHAMHWDGYGGSHQYLGSGVVSYPATADGFHVYSLKWEPGHLEFYVDGVKTPFEWTNSRVMSVPAYMILSLQAGGWDHNNAGPQIDNQVMEVDWVRVWSPSP